MQLKRLGLFVILAILPSSCMKPNNDKVTSPNDSQSVRQGNYLYVASGACYSGGNTTFTNLTSSNLLYRIDPSTGLRDSVLVDYFASPANTGDSPVAMVDADPNMLILVENTTNTGSRRIEKISKNDKSLRIPYNQNTTALNAQLRSMVKVADDFLLVSKSSAVEKVKDGSNRSMILTYPWVNLATATATSNCVVNTTLLSSVVTLKNGNIVFAHAATGLNRIGIVSSAGYSATASCLNGNAVVTAPVATAFPTAMVYDAANNQLLVAYAGNVTTTSVNSIYAYPINESANTIGTGVKIYDVNQLGASPGWNYLLYGISAMTYDSAGGVIYVASAINTNTTIAGYKIEKLTYAPAKIGVDNYEVLKRSGSSIFYDYGSDTKCISGLTIAN